MARKSHPTVRRAGAGGAAWRWLQEDARQTEAWYAGKRRGETWRMSDAYVRVPRQILGILPQRFFEAEPRAPGVVLKWLAACLACLLVSVVVLALALFLPPAWSAAAVALLAPAAWIATRRLEGEIRFGVLFLLLAAPVVIVYGRFEGFI